MTYDSAAMFRCSSASRSDRINWTIAGSRAFLLRSATESLVIARKPKAESRPRTFQYTTHGKLVGPLTGIFQRLDKVVGRPNIHEVIQVLCLKASLALLHRSVHNSAFLPDYARKLYLNWISARVGKV